MKEEKKEEKEEKKETKSKSNKTVIIIVVVVAVLVVLGIIGRIVQRKVAQGVAGGFLSAITGGKVGIGGDKNKVTLKSDEGEFSFQEGGKLPDGFPSDFPVYPGAKITSSWTSSGDDSKGISVVLETSDAPTKVADYYKTNIESKGWKTTASFSSEGTTTYSFEKGTTNGFVGIAKGEEGKTNISVTIGVK